MSALPLILLVFAFVFAMIAAVFQPTFAPRWHLGWTAVAFWILSELVSQGGKFIH
jgi:DMSO reductase anchor subunit